MTRRAVALMAALAAAAVVLPSCAKRPAGPVERRVMIIGFDGMEYDVMGPMLEAGRLPNFARLMHEGAWGEIRSLEILESPVIWTSIATGTLPEKHGVTGFVKPRKGGAAQVPTSQNVRRVAALWDILGHEGKTSGVIGWLVTWPAEPIRGYMVTSNFSFGWDGNSPRPQQVTYPEELKSALEPLRMRAGDVPDGLMDEFVKRSAMRVDDPRKRLETLAGFLASDETTRAVGLDLASKMPTDLLAIYFRSVDGPCHTFWVHHFPDSRPASIPEWEVDALGEVIPKYYEYTDRILGEFLRLADDNTTVIVTSDHGFHGPRIVPGQSRAGIGDHDPTGFIVLWGKDIVRGREIADVSVLDVTPTVLALWGLPVGKDMDGRVLEEAIEPRFLKDHPVRTIPSYEEVVQRGHSAEPIESPVDDEIRERMRALGYIE
ncbi:MAG: alkaline phosphatase family protein [Candidatus Eisenbacteria bacterium]|nr:alkaline phosphatase family protein [Candidatus Eisenbacteria bacterium]